MKKITFTIIALMFVVTISKAQTIPNSGFENWKTLGSYSIPEGWGTMNNMTAMSSVYTATMGTPGSPGNSYLKLTSKTVGSNVVNGIAVSGILDSITMQPKSGFAYSGRPSNLIGKWQHMIYGSSQGSIQVIFTRWDVNMKMQMPVGSGNMTLSGMAMSWANFTIPITYVDGANPDSCIIILKASGASPASNDYLWVDNLAFSGGTSGVDEIDKSIVTLNVWPNPSLETLNIQIANNYSQNVKIDILDITGRTIYTKDFANVYGKLNDIIETKDFSKGSYFVKVYSNNVSVSQRFIIQ